MSSNIVFPLVKTYVYYDGPLSYLSKKEDNGELFYSFVVDFTDKNIVYMHCPITPEEVAKLENGELEIRGFLAGKSGTEESIGRQDGLRSYRDRPIMEDEMPSVPMYLNFDNELGYATIIEGDK